MTYNETINYLYAQLPMFSRIGVAAYKENLDNTLKLCAAIDNPEAKFKSIHVAGTNGKGSCSHMLAAILQTAGYKVGLYTSPHLKDFRERIKINGELCSQQFVIDFTESIKPQIEEIQPSFFEVTVAMAFKYFADAKVDIAIIETGLGGRLDSTNIITPVLSVITNIGYDHVNILGNTLQQIATEKAGIIKQNIPVIIGEALPETKNIFIDKAAEAQSHIVFAQDQYYVSEFDHSNNLLQLTVVNNSNDEHDNYALDLTAIYQTKNIITVIAATQQLKKQGYKIDEHILKTALQHVKKLTGLHGRWEVINAHPKMVLDVAHNVDGVTQLSQQLEYETYDKLHIIIGMVKDKDISKVLALLPKTAAYYFTNANIERALPAAELADKAMSTGLSGHVYNNVNDAISEAKTHAKPEDLILICGSFFIIAEVNE